MSREPAASHQSSTLPPPLLSLTNPLKIFALNVKECGEAKKEKAEKSQVKRDKVGVEGLEREGILG